MDGGPSLLNPKNIDDRRRVCRDTCLVWCRRGIIFTAEGQYGCINSKPERSCSIERARTLWSPARILLPTHMYVIQLLYWLNGICSWIGQTPTYDFSDTPIDSDYMLVLLWKWSASRHIPFLLIFYMIELTSKLLKLLSVSFCQIKVYIQFLWMKRIYNLESFLS